MPDTAVLLFLIVVSAPAGFLLSLVAVFGGLPLYYRLRRGAPGGRRAGPAAKICYTLIGTTVFVAGFCGFEACRAVSTQNDFWRYRGASGYWRIPLEEPYELGMRGSMDAGHIGEWRQDSMLIADVIAYEKRGPLVAGQLHGPEAGGGGWFLFDCTDGAVRTFSAIDEFHDACARAGFLPPVAVETVRHLWYVHWGLVEATR